MSLPLFAPRMRPSRICSLASLTASKSRCRSLPASQPESPMRSDTQHAVAIGAGVPVGLLAFDLIVGWIIRGFREDSTLSLCSPRQKLAASELAPIGIDLSQC